MMNQDDLLFQGDCLEIMPWLPNACADMILCDLPYGTTQNKWDSIIAFDALWAQYKRVIKPKGAIVLFGSGMFTAMLMYSNQNMWKYNLIWEKTTPTGFLNAKIMPLRCHEDICVFCSGKTTYNPQKTYGHKRKVSTSMHKRNCVMTDNYGKHNLSTYDSTERYPKSVLTFKTDKQKEAFHPTQKPVALLEYLIRTYTNEGETVLDNTMGSGSTGVACMNTGRKFIGIEKDKSYFEIAKSRIEKAKLGESYDQKSD